MDFFDICQGKDHYEKTQEYFHYGKYPGNHRDRNNISVSHRGKSDHAEIEKVKQVINVGSRLSGDTFKSIGIKLVEAGEIRGKRKNTKSDKQSENPKQALYRMADPDQPGQLI
jgi:hypothetical protein